MPNTGLHNPNGKSNRNHTTPNDEARDHGKGGTLGSDRGTMDDFSKEDRPVIILRALRITDSLIEAMDEGLE
ncbi:MAG: hypothetical protein IPI29_08505 [Ignavibacteria bacterium]|nr:hypothetical protein [Ignavibacteria bacterium]